MLRRITLILALLALVGFGLAQTTIAPTGLNGTEGYGDDAKPASDFGTAGQELAVSAFQEVNLHIPPVVALHLDVTKLTFDISQVGDYADGDWVCVYGPNELDVTTGLLPAGSTAPLGTLYSTAPGWPNIEITQIGGGDPIVVTQYPPIQLDGGEVGELVEGSKNYFVCYRTFILQKFSTIPGWELSVKRTGGTYDMYVQDNTCHDFGALTGLWKLEPGATQDLLGSVDGLTDGTTGALAASCPGNKSWLDDLVVVAVKINGEAAGPNPAQLEYSLTATVPAGYSAP